MDLEAGPEDLNEGISVADNPQTEERTRISGYGGVQDRSAWIRLKPSSKYMQWAELSFNPVVTFVSLSIMPEEASEEFAAWKSWVGNNCSWLYICAADAWIIFMIIIYFSKYSNIKLGPDNSKPIQ